MIKIGRLAMPPSVMVPSKLPLVSTRTSPLQLMSSMRSRMRTMKVLTLGRWVIWERART